MGVLILRPADLQGLGAGSRAEHRQHENRRNKRQSEIGEGDGVDRAVLRAERAADAVVLDFVADQFFTTTGGTTTRQVRLELLAKVLQSREDRIGGGLAQSAEAAGADHA